MNVKTVMLHHDHIMTGGTQSRNGGHKREFSCGVRVSFSSSVGSCVLDLHCCIVVWRVAWLKRFVILKTFDNRSPVIGASPKSTMQMLQSEVEGQWRFSHSYIATAMLCALARTREKEGGREGGRECMCVCVCV